MSIESKRRDGFVWLATSEFPSTLSALMGMRLKRRKQAHAIAYTSLNTDSSLEAQYKATSDKTVPITDSEPTRTQRFLNYLKDRFIKAFPFDGYNPTTEIITCADGKETPYNRKSLPLWVIITSLLGLPNRPHFVMNGVPQYTVAQFFRNFIGGWEPIRMHVSANYKTGDVVTRAVWTEKKIWQIAAIPFKILLILPIKLISIPFKILLNAVKLVTEFLLPIISEAIAKLNVLMIFSIPRLASWTLVDTKSSWKMSGTEERYTEMSDRTEKISVLRVLVLAIPLAILTVLSLAVAIAQYATVLACRAGLALTSPAKSAQIAFALGRNLDIGFPFISNILGVLGALVSLTLSAVLWTMALPLALGALVTAIPSVLTAITWLSQVPFIATSLAWLSSSTLVTGSMTLLNGLFGTVGTALVAAFGPAIGALATVISVQVPAAALTVGLTLGLLVTPVAAVLSLGADKLSNLWATWIESGPIGWIKSLRSKQAYVSVGEPESISLDPASITTPTPIPPTREETYQPKEVYVYKQTSNSRYTVSPHYTLVVSDVALKLVANNIQHLKCAFTVSNDLATKVYHSAARGEIYQGGAAGTAIYKLRLPTDDERKGTKDKSTSSASDYFNTSSLRK